MTRILVVEDDASLKLTYKILLDKEGYQVDRAENGEDALKKAEANEPDLILLDLFMPKVDGLEFLREYDPKNKHPKVKVILFTNVSTSETVDEAMMLGATKYILKFQYSPKELAAVIKEVLEAKTKKSPKK